MLGSVSKYALHDAGYWIALADDSDPHHAAAVHLHAQIERWYAIIPWPILYESVSTRMVRRRHSMNTIAKLLRSPGVCRLDDSPYRERALTSVLRARSDLRQADSCKSLVDAVLREILQDRGKRLAALVSFNPKDFLDVCARRGMLILPNSG